MKRSVRISVAALVTLIALGFLPAPTCAEPKSAPRGDHKDAPQIQDFNFSCTYPYRNEKSPTVSNVSFLYAYEKMEPNSNRSAFAQALQAVNSYLIGLVSTQNVADADKGNLRKTVGIDETTGGVSNTPRIYSVRKAVEHATKSKKFEVRIDYWREDVVVLPDGSRTSRKTNVKTERQTFDLSGDARAAKVEIHCVNCDAVALADQLFSIP